MSPAWIAAGIAIGAGRPAGPGASVRGRARRAIRRRRSVAMLALAGVLAVSLAAFGGSSPSRRRSVAGAAAPHVLPVATRPTAPRAARPPGSLPQTHQYPSATSAQFRSLMGALWTGVVDDALARALPAFFPERAYAQLKSIGDPAADWTNRLEHDFALDLTAAHGLLGRDARRTRLVAVRVVSSYGHWVPPGVCSNGIGYYEMPNARVVYREDGEVRSFGIASMISWRGVWYVVHLGAILRSTDAGTVDAPAIGPGVSAYSGTC